MRTLPFLLAMLGALAGCKDDEARPTPTVTPSPTPVAVPPADAAVATHDVPRATLPDLARLEQVNARAAVWIDARGSLQLARVDGLDALVGAPRTVVADVSALAKALGVDDPPKPADEPPPPPPQGRYSIRGRTTDPQLARQQAIEQARNAGIVGLVAPGWAIGRARAATGISKPHEGTPLYLASPKAPAGALVRALVATGGTIGVLDAAGELRALPTAYAHARGDTATTGQGTWVELHLQPDGAHVVSLPDGKVEIVPYEGDALDPKRLTAAVDAATATAGQAGLFGSVDVVVREALDVQRLVDVLVQLEAAHLHIALAEAPGAPAERAKQVAQARADAPVSASMAGLRGTGMGTGSSVDADAIRSAIQRHQSKFTYCYEKEQAKQPRLAGKVIARFDIGTDGKVANATATGMTAAIDTCVAEVVQRLTFPKASAPTKVSYPFVFKP